MRGLFVKVRQCVSNSDFICKSDIKIYRDDDHKEISNYIEDIILNTIDDIVPFEIDRISVLDNEVIVHIVAPNGRQKSFSFSISSSCDVDYLDKDAIKEYFKKVSDFVKSIESWVDSLRTREFNFYVY